MKRTMLMLTGLAVLFLVLSPAVAAEKAGKNGGGKGEHAKHEGGKGDHGGAMGAHQTLGGDNYDAMVKALKLAPDEASKLKAKFDAKEAALKEWDKTNEAKMTAANDEVAKARTAKDHAAMQTAVASRNALIDERNALVWKQDVEIEASLPAAQKTAWVSQKLNDAVTKNFSRLNLTPEQTKKVETLCDASAAKVDSTNQTAMNEAVAALTQQVKTEVLTDEQRGQLQQTGATEKHHGGKSGGKSKGGATGNT